MLSSSRPSSQIQKLCTHVNFGFIVCGRKMDLCLAIDHGILTLQLLEWNRVLRLTLWQLLNLTLSTRHFTSLHFTIVVYRVNQFLQFCMLYGQISVVYSVSRSFLSEIADFGLIYRQIRQAFGPKSRKIRQFLDLFYILITPYLKNFHFYCIFIH